MRSFFLSHHTNGRDTPGVLPEFIALLTALLPPLINSLWAYFWITLSFAHLSFLTESHVALSGSITGGLVLLIGFGGGICRLMFSQCQSPPGEIRKIDTSTAGPATSVILRTLADMSRRAGIPVLPDLRIFQSGEVNAFATGSKRSGYTFWISSPLFDMASPSIFQAVFAILISDCTVGRTSTLSFFQGALNILISKPMAFTGRLFKNRRSDDVLPFFARLSSLLLLLPFFGAGFFIVIPVLRYLSIMSRTKKEDMFRDIDHKSLENLLIQSKRIGSSGGYYLYYASSISQGDLRPPLFLSTNGK